MHDDLKRLIEFSIEDNAESAIVLFPMFSPKQIHSLYEISISQRLQLRQEWGSEDAEMPYARFTIRRKPRRSGNWQPIRQTILLAGTSDTNPNR